ncbi:MAG TPA: hypothetical protein VM345_03140 [Acidimicrobiales bacterium]|jgi:hypothetical protein|nr:hypothetical protein [Acidimicrobiales bacterium]
MSSTGPTDPTTTRFGHTHYTIRRKVLKLIGGAFTVFDQAGNTVMFADQKGFKLKEDIRLFSGPDMTEELVRIHARRALDISAVYDVIDSKTNVPIGALQRRGMKSVLKDEWWILGDGETQRGAIVEDSMALALVRRFVLNLIPQNFTVTLDGVEVAEMRQQINPFVFKIDLDFSKDPAGRLDRRLAIAAGVLMSAIEGRQQ